jgi:hypothetical protein
MCRPYGRRCYKCGGRIPPLQLAGLKAGSTCSFLPPVPRHGRDLFRCFGSERPWHKPWRERDAPERLSLELNASEPTSASLSLDNSSQIV